MGQGQEEHAGLVAVSTDDGIQACFAAEGFDGHAADQEYHARA